MTTKLTPAQRDSKNRKAREKRANQKPQNQVPTPQVSQTSIPMQEKQPETVEDIIQAQKKPETNKKVYWKRPVMLRGFKVTGLVKEADLKAFIHDTPDECNVNDWLSDTDWYEEMVKVAKAREKKRLGLK